MVQDNSSVILVNKVSKIFRDFWLREKVAAVHELDLSVEPHEVFGLLGPNGSGKSTTLKMILGLLFPTRGQLAVFGRRPSDVAIKERIGFLPEESYLYPFLNARETLDFYGKLFKIPRAQRMQRIDMLLDMVGLSAVAYRRVGEYSKGMQRRIGLAQALINDPDLLILDEPTSGLDPIGTRQIKDLILTLAKRGKTVLLSSHLLGDVEDVCDRVCILYGGRKRAQGSVKELLAQQELTQIVVEHLDEATLEQVRTILAQAGKHVHEITAPREKLESLFLRIVKEAQAQKLTTGGAIAGEVAQFLRRPDAGKQLVEQLLAAAQEPAEDQPAGDDEPQPTGPRVEVLEELLAAKASAQDDDSPRPKPEAPLDQAKADRSVIDSLIDESKGNS